MREHWTYKTFGEVGSFLRGKSIQKADYVEKGMPCIHYGQIHTKFGISTDKHLSEISLELYNRSIIASPGDVIIAITSEDLDGSCKSTAWLGNYDVAVSAHAAVYKHNLNPKFIAYYLRSNSFYVEKEKYARGFKVMEIKPTDIARIPLPTPPSDIQQAIVDELDKMNDVIALKRKQLADFDSLAQSLFYEMFGDPVVNEKNWGLRKLGEIGELARGVSKHRPRNAPELLGGSMPLIQTGDIANADMYLTGFHSTYSDLGVAQSKIWKEGTLCITIAANIGNCAILTFDACFPDSVVGFIVNQGLCNNEYIYYIFKRLQKILEENAPAVAQKNINLSVLNDVEIPLPPLPLQQSFATKIAKIEAEKQRVKSSLKDLETLLASRMQYWFDN